ncbi:LacI family DNA-binding transcriptional regulator [Halomonas sp. DP8Y7-1]|uniref:LacI family DNA-binding transcriptional regulator n=1 Tax=Halomonas sp. DP8Y7-1 TaxID=2859078 RepID=UPI001C941AC2|nr:LacI family DNA-binding transcriptional regulator [Halomonas sp. DP8Y7-1]MBY6028113.1 LacI family DNA-binding transcriptional regulator [Halomonas sp. DP8Y7-1]
MSERQRRTLLEDVAREAGVSTASVSRVLNQAPHVSERLKAKVESAVARLGYVPDGSARALASRRIGAIGALVPTLDNPIFGTMADNLERQLKGHDCRLLLATYRYDLDDELQALRTLVQHGVDGIVLIGHEHHDQTYALLQQRQLPFVTSWQTSSTAQGPCIGFDNAAAARQLVQHLLGLGHRRFGIITAPFGQNDRARARLQGFTDTLTAAGCPAPQIEVVDYGIAEGAAACARLLTSDRPPSALLCGNDTLALGALLEAQRRGVRVPNAFSVTGFDDLPQAAFMTPALTTVSVPAKDIGIQAADALMGWIRHGHRPANITLEAQVKLRQSTGPVPD